MGTDDDAAASVRQGSGVRQQQVGMALDSGQAASGNERSAGAGWPECDVPADYARKRRQILAASIRNRDPPGTRRKGSFAAAPTISKSTLLVDGCCGGRPADRLREPRELITGSGGGTQPGVRGPPGGGRRTCAAGTATVHREPAAGFFGRSRGF